jgi:hypothetical protein
MVRQLAEEVIEQQLFVLRHHRVSRDTGGHA